VRFALELGGGALPGRSLLGPPAIHVAVDAGRRARELVGREGGHGLDLGARGLGIARRLARRLREVPELGSEEPHRRHAESRAEPNAHRRERRRDAPGDALGPARQDGRLAAAGLGDDQRVRALGIGEPRVERGEGVFASAERHASREVIVGERCERAAQRFGEHGEHAVGEHAPRVARSGRMDPTVPGSTPFVGCVRHRGGGRPSMQFSRLGN